MGYKDDPAGYEQRLNAKLTPEHIRSTLAFAGLYQITYEMLKQIVVDKVRDYFCMSLDELMTPEEQEQYRLHVLQLAPKKPFRASLLWLVQMKAISLAQADRLDDVYAHRHSLAHELIKFVIDPDADPDVGLLVDAVLILKDLHRFWIGFEIGIGSFEHVGHVDPDEVTPLSWMMLQQCLNAYLDGLPDSGDRPADTATSPA